MYRLLRAQRLYCGLDTAEPDSELDRARLDCEAAEAAPEGTVLFARRGRDPQSIWVIAEDGRDIYVGPQADYDPGLTVR